jgi:hypothetical protein
MLYYTLHRLSSRFTAGVTAWGRKRAKTEGKGWNKVREGREKPMQGKGTKKRKRKPVLCRVGSELLLSPLPCVSHKTGG